MTEEDAISKIRNPGCTALGGYYVFDQLNEKLFCERLCYYLEHKDDPDVEFTGNGD